MSKHQIEILAGELTDELFCAGLANDRNMLSASALVHPQHHELVVQAHERFIGAGATLVLTGNSYVVPGLGFTTEEIREYTRLAGRLAVEARKRAGAAHDVKIAGALPALMPSYRSDRTVERTCGLETYQLIGEALSPFVDVFVASPMSSIAEASLALEAVDGLKKPVMLAFALNDTGDLRSGEPVVDAIRSVLAFSDERTGTRDPANNVLRGVLFGCSQAEDVAKALCRVRETKELFEELRERGVQLGGFADRISPRSKAGTLEEQLAPGAMHSAMDMEVFASFALRWIADGATVVGGCCGVPPSYFARICERMGDGELTSP